jgi:hypothetical protein
LSTACWCLNGSTCCSWNEKVAESLELYPAPSRGALSRRRRIILFVPKTRGGSGSMHILISKYLANPSLGGADSRCRTCCPLSDISPQTPPTPCRTVFNVSQMRHLTFWLILRVALDRLFGTQRRGDFRPGCVRLVGTTASADPMC